MRIICTKENLYNSLLLIGGVASKSVNLPILNNVLIKAEEQKVSLTATNLEVAIVSQLRAKVEEVGSFTVPTKTLSDFVFLLPEEKVELTLKENELEVACGRSTTKIKGAPAEEFPVVPAVSGGKGYLLNGDDLKKALEQVGHAAAKNNIRQELAGVLFNFSIGEKKELIMAATDSYRLAEKKTIIQQGEEEARIIVPARTALEINRLLALSKTDSNAEKGARLLVSENQIVFRHNEVELISRLVDGQYPDYTQIIPNNFKTTAEFSIQQMIKEVKAASLFTTTGVNAVTFDLQPDSGSVGVFSASAQAGEHKSEMSAEVSGEKNTILLNHRYILDGLNNIESENCLLKVVNGDNPCVLSPKDDDNYLYVVMPIKQ